MTKTFFFSSRVARALLSMLLLIIGCLIYVVFRTRSLLMFKCFDKLELTGIIEQLRCTGKDYSLYDWVKDSMPDGLWLFSYMFLIDTIWEGSRPFSYYFFLWILPVFAITSEVLQATHVVPGVYDTVDLLCYLFAIIIFMILKHIQNRGI